MNKNLDKLKKKGYSLVKEIEEGGFATVYQFKMTKDRTDINLKKNTIVAIKIINNSNNSLKEKYYFTREFKINNLFIKDVEKCKYNNNLVKIYETISFMEYKNIVMECMDTDLFDYSSKLIPQGKNSDHSHLFIKK